MGHSNQLTRRDVLRHAASAATYIATSAIPSAALGPAPTRKADNHMRLGLVTYNVAKDWDLDTIIRISREAGIEGVELRTTHTHGVEPTLSKQARSEVAHKIADSGLKQISLGSVCEFQSPDPKTVQHNLEECARFIELAHDIGARAVKVRPNGLPDGIPTDRTLAQIGHALAECGRTGAEHGVQIWMEVHGPGTMLPQNARKIMDACGHPNVGVTWNSNATDVANRSIGAAFELLRPFIRCCHITELWSDYPWRQLFSLLKKTSYDGFTLCEIPQSIRPEDGATFLRCYRGLWKELCR